jgi:hypothetical protein
MKKYTTPIIIIVLAAVGLWLIPQNPEQQTNDSGAQDSNQMPSDFFVRDGLATDTSKVIIPLEEILDGGPGKDGIPSLEYPEYTSVADADPSITNETKGVLIQSNEEAKFYPYNILVWHEIVNDEIGGDKISVTFCPLCGSAVAYHRVIDGKEYGFGVSGKLWQSNLLMYDRSTESLWSQIEGRAVVGELAGTKLELYPLQLLSFAELQQSHPNAEVLSVNTGHVRDYEFYPYGGYDQNHDEIYFPVSNLDTRLPAKTLMYASVINDEPVAFVREKLLAEKTAELQTQSGIITVNVSEDNEITLTDENGTIYPGYVTMWFSWANHNTGPVWK